MQDGRQRLDKWLWHARLVRTRAAAQALVGDGGVRVNREKTAQTSRPIKVGDVLTVAVGGRVRVLKVIGFADRRGAPASVAALYEDLAPPPPLASERGSPGDPDEGPDRGGGARQDEAD